MSTHISVLKEFCLIIYHSIYLLSSNNIDCLFNHTLCFTEIINTSSMHKALLILLQVNNHLRFRIIYFTRLLEFSTMIVLTKGLLNKSNFVQTASLYFNINLYHCQEVFINIELSQYRSHFLEVQKAERLSSINLNLLGILYF